MISVNRFLVLSLVFLVLSTCTSIISTSAQAVSKPAVPQFTLGFNDSSFDVPPSTTTNIYTGETITEPGYHVENMGITVTIKNQALLEPYIDTDVKKYRLFYYVQVKGHFGGEWKDFAKPFFPSDSEYTVIGGWDSEYKNGGQLDFRVQAIIGLRDTSIVPIFVTEPYYTFVVESDWSEVQTITLPGEYSPLLPSQTATSPNQTPLSAVLSTNLLLGVIACLLCVIAVLTVMFLRRQTKTFNLSNGVSSQKHQC